MKINQLLNKFNIPIRILVPYNCSFCFYIHKALFTVKNKEGFFCGTGKCSDCGLKERVYTFLEHSYNQEIVEIEGKRYVLRTLNGELTTTRWGFSGHYKIDKENKLAWKDNKSYKIKFI